MEMRDKNKKEFREVAILQLNISVEGGHFECGCVYTANYSD